jgi:hypothetical protein
MITVLPIDIFVASGQEVEQERLETVQVANKLEKRWHHLKLNVKKWETDIPSGSCEGKPIQDKINSRLLKSCHIVLVILYSRLGPFTLKEYNLAMKEGKKVFLYFKTGFSPDSSEEEKNYKDLKAFKNRTIAEGKVIYTEYNDINDFHFKLLEDLDFYFHDKYPTPVLDEEVQPNDQEMMTPKKKADRTANERKNTLLQRMKSRMVQIPANMVILKDNESGKSIYR